MGLKERQPGPVPPYSRIPCSDAQKGFTMLEVIVAMVVMGIIAVLMSTGTANIIQGYIFTRDNAHTAMAGQIAMTRLQRELRSLDKEGVISENQTSITYDYIREGNQVKDRTLSWDGTAGSPLLLGKNILVDNVQDFTLDWNDTYTLINVSISLKGASDIVSVFSTRVAPRNL